VTLTEPTRKPDARARSAYFDGDCGVCSQTVRFFTRLDRSRRLHFLPSSTARLEELPAGVEPELLNETILVVDVASGRYWTRAAGVAQLLAALPAGWLLALPVRLTLPVANRLYDVIARNRARISARLGLKACELPADRRAPSRF